MKNFYEFVQLLKENEQPPGDIAAPAGDPKANQPRTGEERRRHFGIQGTGGGRTDDAVIYNNLSVDYDGNFDGEMIVWFDDYKDLEATGSDTGDIVTGYGDVDGNWDFKYNFTVALTDNPSKFYLPGPNGGWPVGLPASHGSGIVKIEIRDLEQSPYDYGGEPDDYNPDPDGNGYWDWHWSQGPGKDY